MQASKDFGQEGANLGRAQGNLYQKPKTPPIWPTIFYECCNFIFVFFQLFYFISVFPSGDGDVPPGCVSAAGRINSGKVHYGMIPALNMHIDDGSEKNAGLV